MVTQIMRRSSFLLAAVPLLLFPGGLLAGHEPCDQPLEHCVTEMAKRIKAKGWVGIEIDYEEDGTLTVTRVIPDSPAEAAGLEVGDRILAMNGISYATADRATLKQAYKAKKPGHTITYSVRRGERKIEVPVKLAHVPEHVMAQWVGQHLLYGHGQEARAEPADKP